MSATEDSLFCAIEMDAFIITEIQIQQFFSIAPPPYTGGAGRGVQGSGPPSPDQGHLWEAPKINEVFFWGGWGRARRAKSTLKPTLQHGLCDS